MSTRGVGALLVVLIALMAIPRIIGPSWRVIAMPNQMRLIEGHLVQWESETMFRTMKAMVTDLPLVEIYPPTFAFSTDEYRAIMPIFTGAVFANVLGSFYWGSMLADLLWWWAGAMATVALLSRIGIPRGVAVIAGVFAATSPLGVAYVGSGNLHAASSLCLPIYSLLIWDVLVAEGRNPVSGGIRIGVFLLAASLTYTYQWVLIPAFGLWLAVGHRCMSRAFALLLGVTVFGGLTFVVRQILGFVGLTVTAHINDPLVVLFGRAGIEDESSARVGVALATVVELVKHWAGQVPSVLVDTMWSYHPLMIALAVLGFANGSWQLRCWVVITSLIALAQGLIYSVPWVTMTAFPFVYGCAAHGVTAVARWGSRRWLKRDGKASPLVRKAGSAAAVGVIIAMVLATNIDLVGIDWYVVKWWGFWYVPH